MAYRETELGLLVRLRPDEAREQILVAYESVDGHEEQAAAALGVTRRTLDRWTESLGLTARAEELRAARRKRESEARKVAAGGS